MGSVKNVGKVIQIPSVSEDDSMAGMFKDLKAYRQGRRRANLARAEADPEFLQQFHKHTDYHYSMTIIEGHLQYWPSANKWQINGNVKQGDLTSFKRWLEKHR